MFWFLSFSVFWSVFSERCSLFTSRNPVVTEIFIFVFFIYGVLFLIFYIWMLVNCFKNIKNNYFSKTRMLIWFALLWMFGPFVIYFYYLSIYRKITV